VERQKQERGEYHKERVILSLNRLKIHLAKFGPHRSTLKEGGCDQAEPHSKRRRRKADLVDKRKGGIDYGAERSRSALFD